MYLTLRRDFTSINRNQNIKSRTKLFSQLICMKLIAQLEEQLQSYTIGAEMWNRLILNNFIFLLKITGKLHYMREGKVANFSSPILVAMFLLSQGSGKADLPLPPLFVFHSHSSVHILLPLAYNMFWFNGFIHDCCISLMI